MSLFGDLIGSINPFTSANDRTMDQYSLIERTDHLRDNFLNVFDPKIAIAKTEANITKSVLHQLPLPQTAKAFDHYLQGNGESINLPYNDLKQFKTVRDAEIKNQDRFLNKSLKETGRLFRKKGLSSFEPVSLTEVRDNDRIFLKDYYDVDANPDSYEHIDPDLSESLGHFKLRTTSKLELIKAGDKLLPYGFVEHRINDKYDYNPGTWPNLLFSPLEKSGNAKTFYNESQWKNYPLGVIKLKGDEIDASGVEWHTMP